MNEFVINVDTKSPRDVGHAKHLVEADADAAAAAAVTYCVANFNALALPPRITGLPRPATNCIELRQRCYHCGVVVCAIKQAIKNNDSKLSCMINIICHLKQSHSCRWNRSRDQRNHCAHAAL
jgi:hypothetical protein